MRWIFNAMVPLALFAGMATATAVMADGNQPPFGKKNQPGKDGDKKKMEQPGDKKTDQPGDKKGPPGDKKGPPMGKSDAVVDAWVKVLIDKITDPHDTVRDSARGAIVAVGPPAVPALQRLADGDDPAKAVAARKLINAIQQRGPGQQFGGPPKERGPGERGPGGMGGFGEGRGFPGMGPMGPGGFGERRGFPGMGPMGPGGFGERRGPGGRDANETELAPMPRIIAVQ